ncbi:MAG TPA: hypothetical protein VMI11_07440, partial [Actinomycetes bacterium]|nr:hypothetical protein [Actinomycetes bacterium]
MARIGNARRLVTIVAGAALLMMAGVGAYAAIPDSGTGTYHGCVNKATGVVRLVDPTLSGNLGHCISTSGPLYETSVTWNQTGPAGATGQAGPPGATG